MTDRKTSSTTGGRKSPRQMFGLPRRELLKTVGAASVIGAAGVGTASGGNGGNSLDCQAIGQAAGRQAMQNNGVCRVNFPRTDLNVSVQGSDLESVEIEPALALTSWIAFKRLDGGAARDGNGGDENRTAGGNETQGNGDGEAQGNGEGGQALMLGDLVLTESEKNQVISRLQQDGIHQTAIHKHLPNLSKPVWWTHVKGIGDPVQMAGTVNAALSETGTPMEESDAGGAGGDIALDTDRLDEIIGHEGQASGGVYKYSIEVEESLTTEGVEIPPPMGGAMPLGFQPLGEGRVAINGDFAMTAEEVNPVIQALREHDIRVVSLHNHMLEEEPRLFFMHFWQTGQATELAQGLRAGLDHAVSKNGNDGDG